MLIFYTFFTMSVALNLPKVAILLLRGLEGCGVSNYSRHMKGYYDSVNGVCDIFALRTKVGRSDTSTDIDVNFFKYSEKNEVIDKLNSNYDVILIFSVPDTSEPTEVVEGYVSEIIEKIDRKKVMVNHDHHAHTFKRNSDFKNAIESCDKVMAHSLNRTNSGFIEWMKKHNVKMPPMEKIDIFFHIPFIQHLINYEKDTRKKRVIHASRAVAWKRGSLILNLQKLLADRGFVAEMIGFERSIAGYTQLKNYEGVLEWFKTTNFTKPIKGPSPFSNSKLNSELMDWLDKVGQDPQYMYVIGSYDYHRGLKRIAESAFATQPRTFEYNKLCYGNTFIEYQGIEAALLSVPIYHRHFLDNVTLPNTNIPLSQTDIFLSIDDDGKPMAKGGPQVINPVEFVDKLEEIWEEDNKYFEYRKKSTEFMTKYFSSKNIVPNLMEKIVS